LEIHWLWRPTIISTLHSSSCHISFSIQKIRNRIRNRIRGL